MNEDEILEVGMKIVMLQKHLTKGPSERDICPLCNCSIYDNCGLSKLDWNKRLATLIQQRKKLE